MLPLSPTDVYTDGSINLRCTKDGRTVFSKACALSGKAQFVLSVRRNLGVYFPKMCIRSDEENTYKELPFEFYDCDEVYDFYELSFDVSDVTKQTALLFFIISFSIGDNLVYFSSINNIDGTLSYEKKSDFKLLVYDDSYKTPDWYKESLMYHIFVDRFFKGAVPVVVKKNALLNEDWYDGIPQYGEKPGAFCANNMFFGGTLYGVCEKLDYLESLGVNVIYLSPIFDSYSNHKYDTGDYEHIDCMFGGDDAFDLLLSECEKRGMRIILDGVFNHTGDDSRYFNKKKTYPEKGAYNSPDSEYYSWYLFKKYPDEYEAWWDIEILPKLDTENIKVEDYLAGENGIAAKYFKKGISGLRLDVADELPDRFLERLRNTAEAINEEPLIIGEVWENAADKIAYGKRRSYFRGKQLDGVMNYPIKDGIVSFVKKADVRALYDAVCDIYSSYPSFVSGTLMNILSTHDTERILTVLSGDRHKEMTNDELSQFKLTKREYELGRKKLFAASVLQYTLPGVPSVFYGDEAGVSGGHDPFCRKTFPWGKEDLKITAHYKTLGRIRRSEKALFYGDIVLEKAEDRVFSFRRIYENESIIVTVNMSDKEYVFHSDAPLLDIYENKKYRKGMKIKTEPLAFTILKYV